MGHNKVVSLVVLVNHNLTLVVMVVRVNCHSNFAHHSRGVATQVIKGHGLGVVGNKGFGNNVVVGVVVNVVLVVLLVVIEILLVICRFHQNHKFFFLHHLLLHPPLLLKAKKVRSSRIKRQYAMKNLEVWRMRAPQFHSQLVLM